MNFHPDNDTSLLGLGWQVVMEEWGSVLVALSCCLLPRWLGEFPALLIAFSALIIIIHHRFRLMRREKYVQLWSLQYALRDPECAATVLGDALPLWMTFPSVERSQWLNHTLESLWPMIADTTSSTIVNALNPVLAQHCPKFLRKLSMGYVNLGRIPPEVEGIQAYKETSNNTVLDLHFKFFGNPDIRIVAAMGVEVEVQLSNLQVKGVARVILGPHCRIWPCFSAVSVSFLEKPHVDFSLIAAKVSLDAIPGLSQWLDGFLRNTLTMMMVHPRRYVVKIHKDSAESQESNADPVGTLYVHVNGCMNLPSPGMLGSLDVFVACCVTSGKSMQRTHSVKKSTNPKFDGAPDMAFTIYNVPNERLVLSVCKNTNLLTKASSFATMHLLGDSLVGKVELFVNTLISDGDAALDSTVRLENPKKVKCNVGMINVSTRFKPFEQPSNTSLAKSRSMSRRSVSREATAAAGKERDLEGFVEVQGGIKFKSGVLMISLECCRGLLRADVFGKSDPYVVFRVGPSETRSSVISRTLDPVYNSTHEVLISDAEHEMLDVRVFDKDVVHDDIIGSLTVPLLEVIRSNGNKLQKTWELEPQGTIQMELRILLR